MPILSVCTSCKSTYRLGTKSCPRCKKALTHFKARIKIDDHWLSRQSQNLGEIRAFLQAQNGGTPPPRGSPPLRSPRKTLVRERGEAVSLPEGPSLRSVWNSFLPWAIDRAPPVLEVIRNPLAFASGAGPGGETCRCRRSPLSGSMTSLKVSLGLPKVGARSGLWCPDCSPGQDDEWATEGRTRSSLSRPSV